MQERLGGRWVVVMVASASSFRPLVLHIVVHRFIFLCST